MKLPNLVAGFVALGCMVPAIAVVLAVIMWKDRTAAVTFAAVAFLLVSAVVAAVAARRFYRAPGMGTSTDM